MTYPFTEDHDMIREAARGFLQDWYDGGKGPEQVYQNGGAYDADAWRAFVQDLGMAGIAIDEAYGGAELGDLGRVVILEELGASLCAMPFSTTGTIVPDLIAACGSEDVKVDLLGRIASGQLSVAYCDGQYALSVANERLSGRVQNVVHAAYTDIMIMTRRVGTGYELFAMRPDIEGLKITPQVTMDPTRSFSTVSLDNVSLTDVTVIGEISPERHRDLIQQSFIGLAAESIGGAQACLDMTLDYVGQRVQFDRPVASFQAVKHRMADMFILLEASRSAVYGAAIAAPEDKTEAALAAKAYATEAFYRIAGDCIQMHGGIGFTWEYPLHFFFKRARANRTMFGTSGQAYDALADIILGDVA